MKNALNFGTPIKLRELALADEPTVAKGGLFYNSDYDKYRIYEDGVVPPWGAVWDNIVSETVLNTEIANLQSQIGSLEWQDSVISIEATPLTPTLGNRYLIGTDVGGTVGGTATGDWAGKVGQIAEGTGTGWVYTTATTGTFVSVDDINLGVYFFGGSTWTFKEWENPAWSDGLQKSGAGAGVLKVLAKNGTILVDSSGVEVGIIGDGNITNNTISGAKLTDNTVYGIKLVDNSVSYTKLNSDVWTYIQNTLVLYDDVTIGRNGSNLLYVKDNAITTEKLAVELDTATKAVKIKGTEGLFVSKLKLNVDGDYAKYAEETYVHAISLTGTATTVTELSALGQAVVEYSIKLGSDYRVGTLYITPTSISDEYVEDADLGITWSILTGTVSVTVAVGTGAMSCTIKKFLS